MLEAVAYLSLFFAGLLFARAAVNNFKFFDGARSGTLLWVLTLLVSIVQTSGFVYPQDLAGNFNINKLLPFYQRQKRDPVIKGRVVTALFFTYLLSVTVATMLDGGVVRSPYSSLIILSGSLGYYLASKHGHTKFAIILFSLIGYFVASVVYVSYVTGSLSLALITHHLRQLPVLYYLVAVIVLAATYTLKKDG